MTDFGRDVSCLDAVRTGRWASGVRLVAEAAYRRLITPAGSLSLLGGEDEANYGFDLADLIGSATSPSDVAALQGRISSELMKDERISNVSADVIVTTVGPAETWNITISAKTSAGPFQLVLAVSGVSVDLLGITA